MKNQQDGNTDQQPTNDDEPIAAESIQTQSDEPGVSDASSVIAHKEAKEPAVHTEHGQAETQISDDILLDRIRSSDRWMIGFTALIAVTGVIGAFIFWYQLLVMQGQLDEMKSGSAQVDKAITEMHRIADTMEATQKQSRDVLDATINNFRLEQRAWVGSRSTDIIDFVEGKPVSIKVMLVNSGRTPALNTKTLYGVAIPKRKLLAQDLLPFDAMKPDGIYQGIMTLLPNSLMRVSANSEEVMSSASIENVKRGKSFVYIFGKITYSDVFNTVHTTRMCMHYDPLVNSFNNCETYNDAD